MKKKQAKTQKKPVTAKKCAFCETCIKKFEEIKKQVKSKPKLYLSLKILALCLIYLFVLGFGFVIGLLIWGIVANLRLQSSCPLEVVLLYCLGFAYGTGLTAYLLLNKIKKIKKQK